jgi:hypothetical protein
VHNHIILVYFGLLQFILTAMPRTNKTSKHAFQIRLPGSVFTPLQARATAENRSLNAMVNILLAEQLLKSPTDGVQQHSTSVATR